MKPEVIKPGFDPATEEAGYHRARQFDPERCTSTPKTISIAEGVKGVVCRTGGDTTSVQTYLFDKEKFTPAEAKDWLAEHSKKGMAIACVEDGHNIVFPAKIKKLEIEEAKQVDKLKRVFLPFAKADEERRVVYGYATTPHLDYEQQKIDIAAIERALPEYLEWGNVREMHDHKKAVGSVLDESVKIDDAGLYVGAKIVDDDCWKKIKERVYRGLSIGIGWEREPVIKITDDAPKGLLTDAEGNRMRIIEISVVDRPANPNAKILAYKIAEGKEEVVAIGKLAATGEGIAAPQPGAGTLRPAPDIKFLSFGEAWMAGEMMEDLPKMVDTLFSVLGNIIYAPEGTAEEKKEAMVASVGEFADKCSSYMTGEKLAEAIAFKTANGKIVDGKKKEPAIKPEPEEEKKIYDASIEKVLQTIETEFAVKLDEAVAQLGALRNENAKLVEINKGLETRVKAIEDTPLPAKGVANPDMVKSNLPASVDDLAQLLQAAAKSPDPKDREMVGRFSVGFVNDMLKGR